jgi:hypothetical protein
MPATFRHLSPAPFLGHHGRFPVILAAIAVLLAPIPLRASFERLAQPASLVGRALAGCATGGADCTQYNPSALVEAGSVHIAVFHTPAMFELSELSQSGMSAASPLPIGALQLTLTRFGTTLYREHMAMLTYAARLDETFAVGASFSYNALSIDRYGSAHAWGVDLGVSANPATGLTIGAAMLNVNRPTIGAGADELPRMFSVGMAYRLSPQACFSADMVKDVRFPESIRAGIEVAPLNFIALRTGVSTEPSRFYGGLGIRIASIEINYAVVTHQELGLTHTFGISFDP